MCYLIILVVFLVGFFILSWRRLDWAVMLIIAGLPLYLVRFNVLGIPMTLLEAMILIVFFCWLIFYTRLKDFFGGRYGLKEFLKNSPFARGGSAEGRRKYPFGIEIALLLIISLIAVGTAGFTAGAFGIWKAYFFEPALLYILILNIPLLGRPAFDLGFGKAMGGKFPSLEGCPPRADGVGFQPVAAAATGWINKIGLSLAVGAFAVSAYAIFQKFTGFGIENPLWAAEATRRVVSFFGYPNAVGLYLAPIILVLVSFLSLPSKKVSSPKEEKIYFPLKKENISVLGLSRGFLTFIVLLSLAGIYFAGSEGAIVALAAAFVICGLLGNKKTRLAVLAFVVVAVIAISLVPNGFKVVEQKLTLHDFSGQVRRYQWKETLIMLGQGRFYQGAGLDNYQEAVAPYHQEGFFYDDGTDPDFHKHTVESAEYRAKTWQPVEIYKYPHNIFLNFWSELGLAGMLLFIWIIGKVFFISLKNLKIISKFKIQNSKFLSLGLFGAMIVIIIHGLVDVPYFKNDLSGLFWILIALTVLLRLKLTTSEKSIK